MTDLKDQNNPKTTSETNEEFVETVKEEIIVNEQPTTAAVIATISKSPIVKSQTLSSDEKTANDIDFSVVDSLPPQTNNDAINDTLITEKGEKSANTKNSKKKDDKKSDVLPLSQLFRYATPTDKLYIVLGIIIFLHKNNININSILF